MFGKWLLGLLVPLALAAALGACASNGVQPGIVSTSSGTTATASTYGNAVPGEPGRVVAINEVSLAGSGGGGVGAGMIWRRLTGLPQGSEKRFGGCVRAVGLRVQPWSHVRGARRISAGAGQ